MDYSVLMQVFQGVDDLRCVALDFKFMKALASFQKLVHALVRAQLQQDVHVLAVLEEVLEVADVCVFDAAVNLDFTHKLLFGATFGQT